MSAASSLRSASPFALDAAVHRLPLAGGVEHVTAPEGATIAEFVAIAFPAEAHRSHVVAILDGEEIAPEAWGRAPRAGETLQLVFRPGGKDFLRTLLQIAVIAVAVWVTGGGLGGWFAAGTWQTAVAAAGVSILGNLAINALIPLPKPDGFPAPTPYYSLSSARNASRQWAAVPMLFGRHRIVPPRISDPIQEVIGGATYLRFALCLGLCPMQVSDWKIGETALSSFSGVDIELRLTEDAPAHTLITGDPVQDAVGATLTHTAWTERTTATDVDEIEVIYDFPSGLGGLDSKGRKTARTVNLRLQYRPTGSAEAWTDWRPTVSQANTASAGAGVPYRPEYFDFEGDLSAWRGQLGGMGGVAGDIVAVTRSDPGRAFRHSERFAVPRGQYDVRTQRAEAVSTDPNIVDAVSWSVLGSIRSAADPFPNRKLATACFRIKATDQLSNMVDTLNCIAESLQPVFSAGALADPTTADAGEFTTVATSSNPAVLALLAMRGANTAYPKPDEEVDWPSFAVAAAKFAARGLTFNEYVESDIGRWEMVSRILAAGHARAVKHNGRVSVVVDDSKAGQPPAQTFTPRNVLNFRWQKTFPRLPHAIRTPFANADNGWQADEVTVYLPGQSAETATRYETVAMPGKTDPDEIRTVVNQYARNSYFQTESFEFETDAEHLTVKRGDYCVVQHHAMATGLGAARIASREVNGGGAVTAIVLDADLETPVGESLAVQWRTIVVESGFAHMEVIGEQAVARDAGNPRRFVFTTPQSGSTKPVARGDTYEGDIALVGIAGKVSLEVLVRDIQPRPHLRAGISCVAYAGERFVDAPAWPAHEPKVTRPYAPRPSAPVLQSAIARDTEIAVAFTQPVSPTGVEITGYAIAWREKGSTGDTWEPMGSLAPDERVAVLPAGEPGAKYQVRIVAFGRRDDGLLVYSNALVIDEVTAVTAPPAPSGCAASFVTRTSAAGSQQLVLKASWTLNQKPDVVDTLVLQRISTGPDVWEEIGRGAAESGKCEINGLSVGATYVIGFANVSKRGARSAVTAISSITAPDSLRAGSAGTASIVAKSSVEDNTLGTWTGTGLAIQPSWTSPLPFTKGFRITGNYTAAEDVWTEVSPGEVLFGSGWLRSAGTVGVVSVAVEFRNAANASVGSPLTLISQTGVAEWEFKKSPSGVTVPATACKVRALLVHTGGSGGHSGHYALPQVTRHQVAADKTGENVAPSVVGQGLLAVQNHVVPGVTIRDSAGNLLGNAELLNSQVAFASRRAWDFDAGLTGWAGRTTTGNVTTVSAGVVTLTAGGTNSTYFHQTADMNLAGKDIPFIRARIRRTDADPDTNWAGQCIFSTPGHGQSFSFEKTIAGPQAAQNEWFIAEWDMRSLTTGTATDWIDSTILRFRLAFSSSASAVFEVDWVAVGRRTLDAFTLRGVTDLADQTGANVASSVTGQGLFALGNFYEQSSDPGAVANGSIWFKTGTNELFIRRTGAWGKVADIAPAPSVPATQQTFTKLAAISGVTTSGTTAALLASIDVSDVGAGGYLSLPVGNLLNASLTIAFSSGTTWDGQLILTEDLQSGGGETTVGTWPLQVEDTGGGFFAINWPGDIAPWPSALVAQTKSGAVRYRLKIQRTAGSNNITGGGLNGQFMIQRVPG